MTSITSPKLEELNNQLKNGNEKALYTFLHEIKSNNTPLIEQCPVDSQYSLITYIWLGDRKTETVYVFGSFPGWDLSVNQLKRLLQTDIWYQTFRTDKSFISTYYFSVNDVFENDWIKRSEQYQLDQFNGNTFGEGANRASVLSIGMKVQYSSRFPSNHYPSGKIETHSFHSTILNNTRRIHIYTPHDYSHTSHLQELLIVFDGNSFINNFSIERTLNYLIHAKKNPSCIAVAIEPVNRLEELTYNDKMNAFLTEELLPWIQAKYRVHQEAKHTTIAGFSLGGLAAFYAALQNPHIFGNVLSMSGSVHWKKDAYENKIPWIENQISSINSNTSQPHFYIAAGELENKPLLTANRSLYKALKEKEYQITYEEFQGGHDSVWWREKLFDGLIALKHTKTTLKNEKGNESMNQDELDKNLKKQEILVKDEKVWSYTYEDHISSIVKEAEKKGSFDNLPGKGKPLNLDKDLSYNPEKQLYRTLKNNHVLPRWIEISKEIDDLKERLKENTNITEAADLIRTINKKVLEHNLICPPSAQKTRVKTDF
ncbi:DnaJ family domain-containing protein [Bacillus sp. NH11B]|uniref:DnaJ family domain-containing protein n=1 Tax=Bacillus sp. NH11B TaxID=1866314 RepID=UPI000AEA3D25|nr:DnaJ family domain-containing protein [Bacillus sp. NH11B]